MPKAFAGNPEAGDLLAEALKRVRITDSMQYCFMPHGEWTTDASPAPYKPKDAVGFHIVAAGACWLDMRGARTTLEAGDIAAFPFGTPHMLGAGEGGRLIDPGEALPPPPWPETPMLRFGDEGPVVRILCGYIRCEAMNFGPFRDLMPEFIHVRTARAEAGDWLAGAVRQIVAEADEPRRGGATVLERLTEIAFLEVLRRQFLRADGAATGWLAAIRDPALARCIGIVHADPSRDWTLRALAREAALSRSALSERFASILGVAPIQYLREWRLYLASLSLKAPEATVGAVARAAGYGTEASFSRAFSRRFGAPPAEWRRAAAERERPAAG